VLAAGEARLDTRHDETLMLFVFLLAHALCPSQIDLTTRLYCVILYLRGNAIASESAKALAANPGSPD